MNARDVITTKLPFAYAIKQAWADEIIAALTAAGYRIVGPGEVDAETVERCAAEAWAARAAARDVDWWINATKKDVSAHSCRSVATAIRALKGGDNG